MYNAAASRPGLMLGLIDVAPDERPALAWSFLFFFFQLTGYYVLRSVRDAAIAADGARLIPTVFTSVFFCMLALMPVFGAVVSRYPRRQFLPIVYGVVVVSLVAFSFAFGSDINVLWMATAFAIFLSVINLFTDSVFWSFMSDIFVTQQAKRLFGVIAAGGTAGAIVGPLTTRMIVGHIGVPNLLLLSAALYGACFYCLHRLVPWARAQEAKQHREDGERPIGGSILAGARLVVRNPMLFALVLHMFLGLSVGTLFYNQQAQVVGAMNLSAVGRSEYYATIDLAMNLSALAVQLLLTPRLMTRYGVAPALIVPALLQIVGTGSLLFAFSATLLAVVQIVTRSLTFSMVKPARESLFTRVDRESRYKAKNFIDTVVYRGSDMTTSWVYQGLAQGLGFSLAALAGVWTIVAMLWLLVVLWLVRLQRQVPETDLEHPVP
jgi:AAA family ATP:ADP antiporter